MADGEVIPALQRAHQRARELYQSEAFRNAYVAGATSALAGRPADDCPYPRTRGRSTWTNVRRKAWLLGHGSVA